MEHAQLPAGPAIAANARFDRAVRKFLKKWVRRNADEPLLRFDQPPAEHLAGDALRDLFLNRPGALQDLLKKKAIFRHLGRSVEEVHFDGLSGDPLLSLTEQRVYNLARRLGEEATHVPFRSVHPHKQTVTGDTAAISTYPAGSEQLRYNSGNHFSSRPANQNVFAEHSRQVTAIQNGHLRVYYEHGFMADRLRDVIIATQDARLAGRKEQLYFVICSRHSLKEGHFGVTQLVMDPANPLFPERVLICDTLLKELPQHPRWWPSFIEAFTAVFGPAVAELIEDLSHPLQKVNIKGDDPYNHDWDCPYYAAAMARALAILAAGSTALIREGSPAAIHQAMTALMPEYYDPDGQLKDRQAIRSANRAKRWNSGRELIRQLAEAPATRTSS